MADNQILGQDDIDALLAQTEKTTDPEKPAEDALTAPLKQQEKSDLSDEFSDGPATKKGRKSIRRSNEKAKEMSVQLYQKAILQRDAGIKVIWNASGVLPMAEGLRMKIKGIEYVSMGVLHDRHLVVGDKR
jgi:hypothetical protein